MFSDIAGSFYKLPPVFRYGVPASYFFPPSRQYRLGRKIICHRRYSFSSGAGTSRLRPYFFSAGCEETVRLLEKCARQLEWPTPFFLALATIGRSNILPGPFRFGFFF